MSSRLTQYIQVLCCLNTPDGGSSRSLDSRSDIHACCCAPSIGEAERVDCPQHPVFRVVECPPSKRETEQVDHSQHPIFQTLHGPSSSRAPFPIPSIDRQYDLAGEAEKQMDEITNLRNTVGSPLMGSDNAGIGTGGGNSPLNSGVSEPPGLDDRVCKAKAVYAYTGSTDDPNEISFQKGELLDILDKQGKWWGVKKSDGTVGVAPSNYLQILEDDSTAGSPLMGSDNAGIGTGGRNAPLNSGVSEPPGLDDRVYKARAQYAYTGSADDPNEISFQKGELLDILNKQGKWWGVKKSDGTVGVAPSNYLQLL